MHLIERLHCTCNSSNIHQANSLVSWRCPACVCMSVHARNDVEQQRNLCHIYDTVERNISYIHKSSLHHQIRMITTSRKSATLLSSIPVRVGAAAKLSSSSSLNSTSSFLNGKVKSNLISSSMRPLSALSSYSMVSPYHAPHGVRSFSSSVLPFGDGASGSLLNRGSTPVNIGIMIVPQQRYVIH